MNNIWFCADHHFGHKNIIQYENKYRPFKTIEEMNEKIIERHNSVVKHNDTVYMLGDFCFGKHNMAIANHLHGKKRLILGNHDIYDSSEYLRYFERLYGAKEWERCILTHIPVHVSNLSSRFFLNVHGHLHSKRVQNYMHIGKGLCTKHEYQDDPNYFCVSLEQNDLTPIHADIIRDRIKLIDKEIKAEEGL